MSGRQYNLLREFVNSGRIGIHGVKHYNQITFRSMLIRGWVVWSGSSFRVTSAGRDALQDFDASEFTRKDPSRPLTSYFNAKLYHIKGAE